MRNNTVENSGVKLSNLEAYLESRGLGGTGGAASASIEDHDLEMKNEQQLHRCHTKTGFVNS